MRRHFDFWECNLRFAKKLLLAAKNTYLNIRQLPNYVHNHLRKVTFKSKQSLRCDLIDFDKSRESKPSPYDRKMKLKELTSL